MSVDASLLIEFSYALDIPDVAGILGNRAIRKPGSGFPFSMGLSFLFGLLKGLDLGFCQNIRVLSCPRLQHLLFYLRRYAIGDLWCSSGLRK